ncbi:hypothetical protein [Nocardia sp. NPDC005998]
MITTSLQHVGVNRRMMGNEGTKEIGAVMETLVVWVLACLLYWWGLL